MRKSSRSVEPKTEDGRWLRDQRLALGLSQPTFGALFGVNHRTVSDWEMGRHPLPYRARIEQVVPMLVPGLDDAVEQMRRTLRQRREALGITQGELARMLRVSKNMPTRWEQGESPIPARMVPEIGQVLTRTPPSARILSDHHAEPASDEWHATLRARRKAVGATVAYLATMIGCGSATLGCWEAGRRRTNAATARRVDEILARLATNRDTPVAAQDEAGVASSGEQVPTAILTPLAPVARRRAPQRPTSSVVLFPSRASGSSSA